MNAYLAGTAYTDAAHGAGDENVVKIVHRCIAVLRGTAPAGEHLNKETAVRLLAHHVGDMHQPLHCGIGGFVRSLQGAAQLAQPGQLASAVKDNGGNLLEIANRGGDGFHGFWDGKMVDAGRGGRTRADYINHLVSLVGGRPNVQQGWRLNGELLELPAAWATESSMLAAQAYAGLDLSGLGLNQGRFQGQVVLRDHPSPYEERFAPSVNQRLALAGMRLAAILNEVLQ